LYLINEYVSKNIKNLRSFETQVKHLAKEKHYVLCKYGVFHLLLIAFWQYKNLLLCFDVNNVFEWGESKHNVVVTGFRHNFDFLGWWMLSLPLHSIIYSEWSNCFVCSKQFYYPACATFCTRPFEQDKIGANVINIITF